MSSNTGSCSCQTSQQMKGGAASAQGGKQGCSCQQPTAGSQAERRTPVQDTKQGQTSERAKGQPSGAPRRAPSSPQRPRGPMGAGTALPPGADVQSETRRPAPAPAGERLTPKDATTRKSPPKAPRPRRTERQLALIGALLAGVEPPPRKRAPRTRKATGPGRASPKGETLRPRPMPAEWQLQSEQECGTDPEPVVVQRLEAQSNVPPAQRQEPARTQVLLPGFHLPVPEEGAVVPLLSAAIQALRASRGALIRPVRGALRPQEDGCHTLLRARPAASTVSRPQTEDRTTGDVIYSDDSDEGVPWVSAEAEGDGTDEVDESGDSYEADGEDSFSDDWEPVLSGPPVMLGYRTVSFEVDPSWLAEYMADFATLYRTRRLSSSSATYGMVSSIDDTLDLLWMPFRTAAKGSHETFQRLIGCYNLPRSCSTNVETSYAEYVDEPTSIPAADKPDLFWHLDWGPAQKVFLYALQLVYTYNEHLENGQIPEPCDGIREFVTGALEARNVTNKVGEECRIVIHFRNAESGYGLVNAPCRVIARTSCDSGYRIDHPEEGYIAGLPFDFYVLSWQQGSECFSGRASSDVGCRGPRRETGSGAYADRDLWSITTHPIDLHFRGAVCDYILFLARLAMDYAFNGDLEWEDSLSLLVDAAHLARYALRIISAFSEMLIHEMGHLYVGESGHCSQNSCMSISGSQWGCKVRGTLGLPARVRSPINEASYPNTRDDWDVEDHRHLDKIRDYRYEMCDTIREGVVGQDALYCSTGCLTKYDELPLPTDDLSDAHRAAELEKFLSCIGGISWAEG